MTEETIERIVERQIDVLDSKYMNGDMTTETYNKKYKEISEFAERELRKIKSY